MVVTSAATKRLILVSQRRSVTKGADNGGIEPAEKVTEAELWELVIGLTAVEYPKDYGFEPNRGLVYLQYVDTTGLFKPREAQKSVTRALVNAYIMACKDVGFRRCHIFAKANPSYMFPGSEGIPAKGRLDDAKVPSCRPPPIVLC